MEKPPVLSDKNLRKAERKLNELLAIDNLIQQARQKTAREIKEKLESKNYHLNLRQAGLFQLVLLEKDWQTFWDKYLNRAEKEIGKHPICKYPQSKCPNMEEKDGSCLLRNPFDCPKEAKPPLLTDKKIKDIQRECEVMQYVGLAEHGIAEAQRDDTWQKAQDYYEPLI